MEKIYEQLSIEERTMIQTQLGRQRDVVDFLT